MYLHIVWRLPLQPTCLCTRYSSYEASKDYYFICWLATRGTMVHFNTDKALKIACVYKPHSSYIVTICQLLVLVHKKFCEL